MSNALEANYEFMKKSPVYLELKSKYKALKKQNQKLVEMMLDMRALCEELQKAKKEPEKKIEIKKEPVDRKEVIVIEDETTDNESNVEVEETVEEEVEEEEVEEEEVEETVEEEEVEETVEEVEVEETVEEEEVEETVEETVEEEEVEETVEETVEEVEETEEEEGVYEIEINGTRYYTTNEQTGMVYAVLDDDDVGEQIGHFENGVFILE